MNDVMKSGDLNDEGLSPEDLQRGYAQWVEITIMPYNTDCKITKPYLDHGKFYKPGNKSVEVYPSNIEGTLVKDGEAYTIAACGRSNTAVGTQGSFEVIDGDKKVFKYWFSCPWNTQKNTDKLIDVNNERFDVKKIGGNYNGGALGNIYITITKK
ncbi:aegerolysin family protein [Vibrio sp. 11986-1-5]|uniref:aegerolysin family protein n=1 Tax=Vibrio sp. 11986-1-5 TaxID=2211215 RepID=UPI000D72CC1A|nr:aegerolysin family protein [Vibrio sp. 11986-1-5]PXA69750.1 aegerolysin [Vibrio sp. 11986-1-5]